MEILSKMWARAVEEGYVSSFRVGNYSTNSLLVSHLLFAVNFFCGEGWTINLNSIL
jgi:hypothetical protein